MHLRYTFFLRRLRLFLYTKYVARDRRRVPSRPVSLEGCSIFWRCFWSRLCHQKTALASKWSTLWLLLSKNQIAPHLCIYLTLCLLDRKDSKWGSSQRLETWCFCRCWPRGHGQRHGRSAAPRVWQPVFPSLLCENVPEEVFSSILHHHRLSVFSAEQHGRSVTPPHFITPVWSPLVTHSRKNI